MSESTTPQLTEREVEEIDRQTERYLAGLVFGEPERGNRYVESLDQNIYFEENTDTEFDAFDLLRQFPALIRDWRALHELVYVPKILPDDEQITYRDQAQRLLRQNAALREQLAHVTASLEELRGLRDKWLALLNPTSADETVEGAIRNLQQAYTSERDKPCATDGCQDEPFFRPVRIEGWHKGIDGGGWYIRDARNKIILEVGFDENEQLEGRPVTGGNPTARAVVALINGDAATEMRNACVNHLQATADALEELRQCRDRWLAMLNPASPDETVDGAIRNLQQAYATERDNAAELQTENAALRERLAQACKQRDIWERARRDDEYTFERIATSIGMSWCCMAETMELESRIKKLVTARNELQSQLAQVTVERDALKRGEFICQRCHLRKDAEFERGDF